MHKMSARDERFYDAGIEFGRAQMAAERDALQAENATLREVIAHASELMTRGEYYSALIKERDALQARLDAMTVEWHTTRSVNGTGSRTQVRSVTPWTVVPEGDTNA